MPLLSQFQATEPHLLLAERAMKSLVPGTEIVYHICKFEPTLFSTPLILKAMYGSAINDRSRWPFRQKTRKKALRELSDPSRFHFNFWREGEEIGARDLLTRYAEEVLYTYEALLGLGNFRLAEQVQEAAQMLDVCVPLGKRIREMNSVVLYWL